MSANSDPIDGRRLCEQIGDALGRLVEIHREIDPPERWSTTDEPAWRLRLRKVFLHTFALCGWEVDVDAAHVMAVELRAAFAQMAAIWKCLPEEVRIRELDRTWTEETRTGLLATFDHPTMASLALPFGLGGFDETDSRIGHVLLAVRLNYLVAGYGIALVHLAGILGFEGDVDSRVTPIVDAVAAALEEAEASTKDASETRSD